MAPAKEYKLKAGGKKVFENLLCVTCRAPLMKLNLPHQEFCVSGCAARSQYWFPGILLDVQNVKERNDFNCSFRYG